MSTRKARAWRIVGIGAVALVVVFVLVIGAAFLYGRSALRHFEAADGSYAELVHAYGAAGEFAQLNAGPVARSRVETFLEVREALAARREALSASLCILSASELRTGGCAEASRLARVLAGAVLPRRLAEYHQARNAELLRREMSVGEYSYLYALVYHSWLGKPLSDGPSFELVGRRGYIFESIAPSDPGEVQEARRGRARQSLHRLMHDVLRSRQTRALEAGSETGADSWSAALSRELDELIADSARLAWDDGLPDPLLANLAPYRERLERAYDPMTNALEIGLVRRAFPLDEGAEAERTALAGGDSGGN